MEKRKILVVDDESRMRKLVRDFLVKQGFEVSEAVDGEDALNQFYAQKDIALIILDVMMPKINGWDVCKEIRENSKVPIIMLTAKDAETDKITGLTLGADDYITKPFCPLELVARVKAQLRRYKRYNPAQAPVQDKPSDVILHSGLELNTGTHDCFLHDKPLALTPTEFSILRILLERKGKVVSSEELFHEIWKDEYYSTKPSKRRKKPFTPTMAS